MDYTNTDIKQLVLKRLNKNHHNVYKIEDLYTIAELQNTYIELLQMGKLPTECQAYYAGINIMIHNNIISGHISYEKITLNGDVVKIYYIIENKNKTDQGKNAYFPIS